MGAHPRFLPVRLHEPRNFQIQELVARIATLTNEVASIDAMIDFSWDYLGDLAGRVPWPEEQLGRREAAHQRWHRRKTASADNPKKIEEFVEKTGSNLHLIDKLVSFAPRDEWKLVVNQRPFVTTPILDRLRAQRAATETGHI
jgi:hypothetical protein